jgi:RNA polymerase sigma-70 factor (ECF subfamily)
LGADARAGFVRGLPRPAGVRRARGGPRRLPPLRPRADRPGPAAVREAAVQSAFKSFFVRQRDGRVRVETWNNLWGLLTLITLRKCADRVEYLRAGRRDVGREVAAPGDEVQPWEVAPGREPSAHEAAVLAETVERLFRCVDEDARPVLELSLQGYSAAEIALRLGRALRTVHRLRERVQKQLLRLRADG